MGRLALQFAINIEWRPAVDRRQLLDQLGKRLGCVQIAEMMSNTSRLVCMIGLPPPAIPVRESQAGHFGSPWTDRSVAYPPRLLCAATSGSSADCGICTTRRTDMIANSGGLQPGILLALRHQPAEVIERQEP